MEGLLLIILISISAGTILIGLFIFLKPVLTFDIQKKFYAKINWRIEPISLEKEIRNTKIMGLFLLALSLFTIAYTLMINR